MLTLARIRVSGEIAGLLIYIGIICMIGGLCSSIINFISNNMVKSESVKKTMSRVESSIWIVLVILGVLDIFGIFPTLSRFF